MKHYCDMLIQVRTNLGPVSIVFEPLRSKVKNGV